MLQRWREEDWYSVDKTTSPPYPSAILIHDSFVAPNAWAFHLFSFSSLALFLFIILFDIFQNAHVYSWKCDVNCAEVSLQAEKHATQNIFH